MKGLREKFRKNEGFTMVELLIVVAIIGILAAVSIPMFNNALEKARHGVDAANIRSAISMGNAEAIASLKPATEFADYQYYDYVVDEADNGDHQAKLVKTSAGSDTGVKPKCSKAADSGAPLQVRIKYNPNPKEPLNEFVIETNWTIGTDGHITAKAYT